MTFTFGSLFAGIGGIDLGLERAGMTCKWQVEIDDYASKVLAKHWPHVRRYRDVKDCGAHNLEPVQLIAGGFPCQPHSVAGKRRGGEDHRNLWPEMCRIVAELRPAWVLGENVPGIRTTMLDEVLSDLEALGYATTALVIPACALDAPHRRERVFVIAHADRAGQHEQSVSVRPMGRRQQADHTDTGWICSDVSNTYSAGLSQWERRETAQRAQSAVERCCRWAAEPDVGRVADGVPHRVDRIRCLGNAVVPQVAQFIGEMILAWIDERSM